MIESSGIINKKLIWGLLACLVIYVICRSVAAAPGKSLWYDELLTLVVSSLGSWQARMTPLRLALDGQPPLSYVFEHYALGLTRSKEIALRLPSILAFPCTLACVFVYVRRRGGEIVAFLCALFLLLTNVFLYYAVEARPYSMVVACIAFALVCYQRVPSALWTLLLAISLALAQSLHYLAVLSMVPFGLAELVFLLKTHRFRWPVWVALVVGASPLLVFWKLLAINKEYYGARFWVHFEFSAIPRAYGELFMTGSQFGAGIAAVAMAGVLGTALLLQSVKNGDTEQEIADLTEATLLFAFVALPFAAYLITSVVHVGLATRYFLSTAIGISLALGYIFSRARLGAVALFAVFVFSVVGVHELHFWRFFRSQIHVVESTGLAAEKFIESAGHKDLPVVIPYGVEFVELSHYAPQYAGERFTYLMEEPPPDDKNWSDSLNKNIHLLQSYLPLRVSYLQEFTSAHKEFLIYLEEKDPGRDWLTLRLVREGRPLQTVALDDTRRVYLVTGERYALHE